MANEIVMTKEGYDDLVKELNELKRPAAQRSPRKSVLHAASAIFLRTANMMKRKTSRPLWRPAS